MLVAKQLDFWPYVRNSHCYVCLTGNRLEPVIEVFSGMFVYLPTPGSTNWHTCSAFVTNLPSISNVNLSQHTHSHVTQKRDCCKNQNNSNRSFYEKTNPNRPFIHCECHALPAWIRYLYTLDAVSNAIVRGIQGK